MRFTFPPYGKKLSGFSLKQNYNQYNIISLIPSPLAGEGEGDGELTFGNSTLLGLF
jgi:hypothetical protein